MECKKQREKHHDTTPLQHTQPPHCQSTTAWQVYVFISIAVSIDPSARNFVPTPLALLKTLVRWSPFNDSPDSLPLDWPRFAKPTIGNAGSRNGTRYGMVRNRPLRSNTSRTDLDFLAICFESQQRLSKGFTMSIGSSSALGDDQFFKCSAAPCPRLSQACSTPRDVWLGFALSQLHLGNREPYSKAYLAVRE